MIFLLCEPETLPYEISGLIRSSSLRW